LYLILIYNYRSPLGYLEVLNVVESDLWLNSLDWSEALDHDVGDVETNLVVVVVGEVSFHGGEVLVDLGDVVEDVLDEDSWELLWVFEDFSPDLDSVEFGLHGDAVGHVNFESLDDFVDLHNSIDDVGDSLLLEVSEGNFEMSLDVGGILEAGLDVVEFVLLDESEHHSVEEFFNLMDWDQSNGGNEGNENGWVHFEVITFCIK
jgi:hypothetical protein